MGPQLQLPGSVSFGKLLTLCAISSHVHWAVPLCRGVHRIAELAFTCERAPEDPWKLVNMLAITTLSSFPILLQETDTHSIGTEEGH